ncbi:MAG: hypothetical protein IJ355_02930 [Prevotella sp.]|nr:hypothetical protein [Prevotella sp.]
MYRQSEENITLSPIPLGLSCGWDKAATGRLTQLAAPAAAKSGVTESRSGREPE